MKKSQRSTIRSIMFSGRWWTIPGLQVALKKKTGTWAMETTISARIRDLRKNEFGGYTIERKRDPKSKLYKYRLVHSDV